MGSLLIVRHAQASFLSDDYDRLSAIGEAQSQILGEWWVARNVVFDRVFAGPRIRHTDTVKFVSAAYKNFGRDFPLAEVLENSMNTPQKRCWSMAFPSCLKPISTSAIFTPHFLAHWKPMNGALLFSASMR